MCIRFYVIFNNGSEYRSVADSCENVNKHSGSIKGRELRGANLSVKHKDKLCLN
jgi:hypothetical protein